ncbi:MAG: terminase family protein, partial [Pseudomonadota bacterium]
MPWLWELWANPAHQRPPPGDWRLWVILGGRGAGKTRAGAEWIRTRVEGATPLAPGQVHRICLLGETVDQVRRVMIEGESGLLACSPPDRRPTFQPSLGRLTWPNGAEAFIASAANPEALRGPQFDCAWSDELAKWPRAREAWDLLQFCLRLGRDPRQIVTTTPRDVALLREILAAPGTVATHAATSANRANLAPGFIEALEARFRGTAFGRQELGGELLGAVEGALWQRKTIEEARTTRAPELVRIVVAVDPPVTSGAKADECGIVVAGIAAQGETDDRAHAYVLADCTVAQQSPQAWASHAAKAYRDYEADRLVAEVNQ